MSEFRRVGGDMVPHRKPAGRRVLLQFEVDLCNAVGLTEDEYWFFVDQAEAYNGERSAEYALVPDVQNGTVAAIVINLVIGIALTAISVLLAPKPKAADNKQLTLKTDDATGRSRFTPQSSFGSIQELATIGSIIPLVFSRQGVRVNSQLLWSELHSQKSHQELRAILLFSHGRLEFEPDFEGFAIGDTLLKDYPNGKFRLYFADGLETSNRIKETAPFSYPNGTLPKLNQGTDVFSVTWHESYSKKSKRRYFSGARTPSSQTEFGVYSPLPNGMRYKVNYELVLVQDSLEKEPKEAQRDKKDKVKANFPIYASIPSRKSSNKTFVYKITGDEVSSKKYGTWGTEDVRQAVERRRIDVDEALSVGESYTIGACIAQCIKAPDEIWEPGTKREYEFKVSEFFHFNNLDQAFKTVEQEGTGDTHYPYEKPTMLRATVGAVTNNRECDATEIGIKSVVWRKINGFPNVNTQPDSKTIEKFEDENGSISLGGMSKFVSRLSFFILQARRIDQNNWTTINDNKVFCVRGQSPVEQYNYLRIYPGQRDQYEYRMVPVGGNFVYKEFKEMCLFDGTSSGKFEHKGYRVYYSGSTVNISPSYTENLEWFKGTPPDVDPGEVSKVSPTSRNTPPSSKDWVKKATRYEQGGGYGYEYAYYEDWNDANDITDVDKFWDGEKVKDGKNVEYRKGDFVKKISGKSGSTAGKVYEIEKWEYQNVTDDPDEQGTTNASGGSGSGLKFRYTQWKVPGSNNDAYTWSVSNGGKNYKVGDKVNFNIGPRKFTVTVKQIEKELDEGDDNLNPRNAIADYYMYDAEDGSHFNGPEHSITYVNEYQKTEVAASYKDLAIAGIRLSSGKEWTSFGELSAYIKKGIRIDRLNPNKPNQDYKDGTDCSDNFPEIAYALLTNKKFGAGETIGTDQVDAWEMAKSAKFCKENQLFWNGVIAEPQDLREFLFTNAAYNFLDFTIKGGRFSLSPSIPYDSNYKIKKNTKIAAKALFTDGNIRKMQVSFLTPEERQMFRATVLYRKDIENGFPEVRTVTVVSTVNAAGKQVSPSKRAALPEETFDMSGFCESRKHAINFAKFALLVRLHVTHGIKFETTPQAALGLEPGDYFRVVSEATHTSRFKTGSVAPDGTIVCNGNLADGTYEVFSWKPGKTKVQNAKMKVKNGKATEASFYGTVFSIRNSTTTDRMYKVESLSYSEEGLVELSGSEVPLNDDSTLKILDWENGNFQISG